MIIGLVGFIGSGKSSVAEYLFAAYNFENESFAGSLKDVLSVVFDWNRNKLEGITKEDRDWRDQIDPWWADRLNISDLTPRKMLQFFGTDIFRNKIHNDIWIASLENKLKNKKNNIVVTDCRFPNEIESIRKLNGIIIRIKRGPEPEWYNQALKLNFNELEKKGIHPSEFAWIGQSFDYIISNDNNLIKLYEQVDQIMSGIKSP